MTSSIYQIVEIPATSLRSVAKKRFPENFLNIFIKTSTMESFSYQPAEKLSSSWRLVPKTPGSI